MPAVDVVSGDITLIVADAIVNAANSSLLGGGGVDGAIHRAGGPDVLAACRQLRAVTLPDGLPAGDAVATTAGLLPARWVIHAVGPHGELPADLVRCLRLARRRRRPPGGRGDPGVDHWGGAGRDGRIRRGRGGCVATRGGSGRRAPELNRRRLPRRGSGYVDIRNHIGGK